MVTATYRARTLDEAGRHRPPAADPTAGSGPLPAARPTKLNPWLLAQRINVGRHAAALRPFTRREFGDDPALPTEGHIKAVNDLLGSLRADLLTHTAEVKASVDTALRRPTTAHLQNVVRFKEHTHTWVMAVERIWDFYFELFGQRQSRFGSWLLACDRIALDCYQYAYVGLPVARSIPSPSPFSYMRTGFSPATFRRGIPLQRLGRQINPFPLIQLPYHRLVNPWTLGAILHEVSHNLQNDLGLARAIPAAISRRLHDGGFGPFVAATWTRWNRETFADLSGLLLGGPSIVASLMDVVGRSPVSVLSFNPRGPHPTPYIRTFISVELLRRMGFEREAEHYRKVWQTIYPNPEAGTIPQVMLETMHEAIAQVVDVICFQPYPSLGGRGLAQVYSFAAKDQQLVEEAAARLATGTDPGVVPERFLIGAARFALDHHLAEPGVITEHFYRELARR